MNSSECNKEPHLLRLYNACRVFAVWQPELQAKTLETVRLAESAARALTCAGTIWIGPRGSGVRACDVPLLWTIGLCDSVRTLVPSEKWTALRELMSDRFVTAWAGRIEASLSPLQRDWFRDGTNASGLMANLEDTLLAGFCAMYVTGLKKEQVVLLADLLELWAAGIYPVGIYHGSQADFLVLLEGPVAPAIPHIRLPKE